MRARLGLLGDLISYLFLYICFVRSLWSKGSSFFSPSFPSGIRFGVGITHRCHFVFPSLCLLFAVIYCVYILNRLKSYLGVFLRVERFFLIAICFVPFRNADQLHCVLSVLFSFGTSVIGFPSSLELLLLLRSVFSGPTSTRITKTLIDFGLVFTFPASDPAGLSLACDVMYDLSYELDIRVQETPGG